MFFNVCYVLKKGLCAEAAALQEQEDTTHLGHVHLFKKMKMKMKLYFMSNYF